MPRDKTVSHEKIIKAAKSEFLEKGFEQASMKSVAEAVGMTSAALYRHFVSKQDMFAALVQPAVDALNKWKKRHVSGSYEILESGNSKEIWDFDAELSDARIVLDVMYKQPEEFRLLICCSAGTPYENCIHDLIEETTDDMMRFLDSCRAHGVNARMIKRDEMHLLVSAYNTALIEPIVHGYSYEEAERYLKTVIDFFTPGWRMITGL